MTVFFQSFTEIGPNEEHVPWKALCAFDGIPFPVDSTCPPEELPLRYVTTLHELQHLVLDLLGEKYPPGTRIKTRKLPRLVNVLTRDDQYLLLCCYRFSCLLPASLVCLVSIDADASELVGEK